MNGYESVLLEKMVEINTARVNAFRRDPHHHPIFDENARRILDLLDCIVDFRELAAEEGCGALVDMRGEVVG